MHFEKIDDDDDYIVKKEVFEKVDDDNDISNILENLNSQTELLDYTYFNAISKDNYKPLLDYYNSLVNKLIKESLKICEGLKFWQEYYYLFYLSLQIINKYYENDSLVISIGESPMKLVFCQTLFYKEFNTYRSTKLSYNNISFKYLSLSNITLLFDKGYELDNLKSINVDQIKVFIEKLNKQFNYVYLDNYWKYLILHNLNPKSIIENENIKHYIFLDRGETFHSMITFIFLYYKCCVHENIDIEKFSLKIKFVTFDGNYDTDLSYILDFIKNFCLILFNKELHYHHLINLWTDKVKTIINDSDISRELILNMRNSICIPAKVLNYISKPEDVKLSSRCIKYNSIKKLIFDINIKDNRDEAKNCNLSLLIIFIIFKLLKSNLINMILDFDNINEELLSILESYNFSSLNPIDDDNVRNHKILPNLDDISHIPSNYILPFNTKYNKKYLKYKIKYLYNK